jgi:uncharacterized membrane protein YsdA (DUF1294 family)
MTTRGYRIRQWTLIATAILATVLIGVLWRFGLPPLYAFFLGLNAMTLGLYGYDKRQAVVGGNRIPEIVLHVAALLGGSPGALAGQSFFRHKTRKRGFQAVFIGILILQVMIVYAYWRLTRS